MEGKLLRVKGVHNASADCWVPLVDHLQTVCPTRPESRSREQHGAEPQAAQTQRQTGQIPTNACWGNPDKVAEASFGVMP